MLNKEEWVKLFESLKLITKSGATKINVRSGDCKVSLYRIVDIIRIDIKPDA